MAETDESQPNDTIQDLQRDKLLLEIRQLRRPYRHSSGFHGVVAATILAIATLSTGYFTGFFDVESRRLELERAVLTKDVGEFRVRKRVLEDSLGRLDSLFSVVQDTVVTLVDARDGLVLALEEQADSLEEREIELSDLRRDLIGTEDKKRYLDTTLHLLTVSMERTQEVVNLLMNTKDSLEQELTVRSEVYEQRITNMADSVRFYRERATTVGLSTEEAGKFDSRAVAYTDTLTILKSWEESYQDWLMFKRISGAGLAVLDKSCFESGMPVVFSSSAISTFGAGLITGANFGDSIGVLHIGVAKHSAWSAKDMELAVRVDQNSILGWSDDVIRLSLPFSQSSALFDPIEEIKAGPSNYRDPFSASHIVVMVQTADGKESRWHSVLHGKFWFPRR